MQLQQLLNKEIRIIVFCFWIYLKEHNITIPVVAKALGNLQEETWEIFKEGGVHVVTEAATEKAIDRLYELVSV